MKRRGRALAFKRKNLALKEENLTLQKGALAFKEKDLVLQEGSLTLQGGETLALKEKKSKHYKERRLKP